MRVGESSPKKKKTRRAKGVLKVKGKKEEGEGRKGGERGQKEQNREEKINKTSSGFGK